MSIPNRVRYFAKQAYQLNLMRGYATSTLAEFVCDVHWPDWNIVTVVHRETNQSWLVPIPAAWANL
jgi:hypothetical protein